MSAFILLSALVYLGWVLFISFRRTAPTWMHRFFAHQYDIKAHPDLQRKIDPVILLCSFVILLTVASIYLVVSTIGLISISMVRNSAWPLLTLVLMISVAWIVGRNLARHSKQYQDGKIKTQVKETLTTSYRVNGWATGDDIRKRLSTGKSSDTVIGIHIGEGVHWNEKGHMLCVADINQDKNISLLLPALLSEGLMEIGASVICLDPNGEKAAVSAPHFLRNGYDVHIVNPFKIPELGHFGNSRFNPLDQVNPDSKDANKFYDMLAMAIYNHNPQREEFSFDDRCRQYISLYIAFARHVGIANFETVCKSLRFPPDARAIRLTQMADDQTFERHHIAAAILSRLSGEMSEAEDRIFSTIEEAISIFNDKNLLASLLTSDFDLKNVAYQPTAIFICIPSDTLSIHAAWARMFLGSLLHTLTKFYNPERKVLVLLDEFIQLSYVDKMVKSMAVLRGYNVTLWTIVDSLKQLRNIYGTNYELFIDSANTKHWLSYGTDKFTTDSIKERISRALMLTNNTSEKLSQKIETKPKEYDCFITPDYMTCELSGLTKPIRFKKIPYWENPFSKDNATKNPFH